MEHPLLSNTMVQQALEYIKKDDERTLSEQLALVEIPAPSHHEREKAEYASKLFKEAGLEDVHLDDVWNVLGTLKGTGNGPAIMLAGHTDTVFPFGTDVKVRKEGNRYCAPGINDDTRAVAEIISVARAFIETGLRPMGDIIFCANVCEEGLGDLKGMKHIFYNDNSIDGFVSVDNPVTGGIVYTATGSRRFLITINGRGGHSFADFGLPNPIHALGRLIARIADFQVPRLPKTTFNVGIINGGTSVNTIAGTCSLLLDLRSDSPAELDRLEKSMRDALDLSVKEENGRWASEHLLTYTVEVKGIRPAGTQSTDAPIVQAAWKASELLGIQPELRDESSTDANIPISLGIPAITIGRGGNEGGVHTIKEWFEPVDAWLGPQRDLLCVLLLAGLEGVQQPMLSRRER